MFQITPRPANPVRWITLSNGVQVNINHASLAQLKAALGCQSFDSLRSASK